MGFIIRVLTGPIGGIFLLSLLVTQCNTGVYEDDIRDDESYIKNHQEVIKGHMDDIKYQEELLVILNNYDEVDSTTGHINTGKYRSTALSKITRINDLIDDELQSIDQLIKNKKPDEKMVELNLRLFDYAWKGAIPLAFLFLISIFNYDNMWYSYKERMREKTIEKPKKIFVITLVNGKYKIIFRRGWWTADPEKLFKTEAEAVSYVDALQKEMLEKHWHKLMG